MEPDGNFKVFNCKIIFFIIIAIRPDRDIIGKQKNPRKRKLKQEQHESSLSSPGTESNRLVF